MKSSRALCAVGSVCLLLAGLPASAEKPSKVKTVPVQQLSERVEKVIKIVEDSTLPCGTRSSVVRRLRKLDDALRSGRRSAAQAMVVAWRQHAWSLEAARVIGPELGGSLQAQLRDMPEQIGYGWPARPGPTRRWAPLTSCDAGTDGLALVSSAVGGSYNPAALDPSADIKIFLKMLLGKVPEVGPLLSGVVDLLWPTGSSATDNAFKELVEEEIYGLVQNQLSGLMDLMVNPATGWNTQLALWKLDCTDPNKPASLCTDEANDTLWVSWSSKLDSFTESARMFQQNNTTDYRVKLLPLYAQYENLYMSFLRDGMMLHDGYWSKVSGKDTQDLAGRAMAYDLDPTHTDRGIGYVSSIYDLGLPPEPPDPADWDHPFDYIDKWNARLKYMRDMTFNVLDYRDTWKFLDARAYPGGVPGGLKLTRMIYSDIVGHPMARPELPPNVAGPLKEVSLWTKVSKGMSGQNHLIGSVQATSPPLLGPAQSGAITGTLSQLPDHAHYYNLNALGPIIGVKAQADYFCGTTAIGFLWARGGDESWQGDVCSHLRDQVFNYEDEVLATVHVVSHMYWDSKAGNIADAFVFGFRYADSFDVAGEAIGVGSGKCIHLPSWDIGAKPQIQGCSTPLSPLDTWSYNIGLQQLSVTNPADGSKRCLDWRPEDTNVVANACDDGAYSSTTGLSSQRWTIDAVGAGVGKITHVKTGQVLTVYLNATTDGTALVLSAYSSGATAQQWRAHSPLTGEIHGIGSGRCLAVPGASPAAGTQAQILQCDGSLSQQWTYNPANKQLTFAQAPSMCLETRGGATALGTVVQIDTCTGAAGQQWALDGEGSTITDVKSGLVLGVSGGETGDGSLVHLSAINGTQAEWWSRTSSQGGALYSVGAGKCLDVVEWSNYSQAVIRSCTSPPNAAQTWTYRPLAQTFTANSPSGTKCLDSVGAAVIVNDCNGRATQKWVRNFANLTIVNVEDPRWALDLTDGTADGALVRMTILPQDSQGNLLPPTSTQQWVWSLN